MHTKIIGICSMLLSFALFGQKEVRKHYTFRNNYPIVFNEDHSIKIDSSDNKWTSYKANNINPLADFNLTSIINDRNGKLRIFLSSFYKAKIFKDEYVDTKLSLYDYENNYTPAPLTNNPLIFPVPYSNENHYYIIYNRYNNFYRQPPSPTEGGFYYRIYDYEHNTLGEEKSIFNLNLNGGRVYGVLNPDPNKLNVVFLCNKTIKLYEINNCGFVFKDSIVVPIGTADDTNPVSPNGNIIVHDFHRSIEPKPDQEVYYYNIDATQGKIKQRFLNSKEFKKGNFWYSATGKHLFTSGFDDADPRKLIRYNVSLSTLDSIIASELVIPSQQFKASYIGFGGFQYALYNQILLPAYVGQIWPRGETYAYIIKDADAPNDVFLSDANIDTLRVKNLTDAELDCNSYFNSMNFYYNPAYRSPEYVNSGTPSLQVPLTRACVGTELQLQGSSFMKDSSRFVVYDPKGVVIVNDTGQKYSFVPDTAGTYKVQLLRSFACHTDTITQYIVVKPEISNILKPDSLHICMENTVNITAADSLEQYSWNTGATTQSIVASEEGAYRVNAYNGCRSLNDSVWVAKSNPEPTNIVTPNGDQLNDHLVINGTKNMSFGLRVFNRWGIKVFESDKYQNNWPNDGNIDNGVYFFEISGYNCQSKGTVEVRKE